MKKNIIYKISSFILSFTLLIANVNFPTYADVTDGYSLWELISNQQMLESGKKDANMRAAARLESTRISEVMGDIQEYPSATSQMGNLSVNVNNTRDNLTESMQIIAQQYRESTAYYGKNAAGEDLYLFPKENYSACIDFFNQATSDVSTFSYLNGQENLLTQDLLDWQNWDVNDPYDAIKIAAINNYIKNTISLGESNINNSFNNYSRTNTKFGWWWRNTATNTVSNIKLYKNVKIRLLEDSSTNDEYLASGVVSFPYNYNTDYYVDLSKTIVSNKINPYIGSTYYYYFATLYSYAVTTSLGSVSSTGDTQYNYNYQNSNPIASTITNAYSQMTASNAFISYTTTYDGDYELAVNAFDLPYTIGFDTPTYNGSIATGTYPYGGNTYNVNISGTYYFAYMQMGTPSVAYYHELGATFADAMALPSTQRGNSIFGQVIAKMLAYGGTQALYGGDLATAQANGFSPTLSNLRTRINEQAIIPEIDLAMAYLFVEGTGTSTGWQGIVKVSEKFERDMDSVPGQRGYQFHNITYRFNNRKFINSVGSNNGYFYNSEWMFGLNYGIPSDNPLTDYKTDIDVRTQIVNYVKMSNDEIEEWNNEHFLLVVPGYILMKVDHSDCGNAGGSGLAVLKWMTSSIIKDNRLNHYEFWIENLSNDNDTDYWGEMVQIPLADDQDANLTKEDLTLDSIDHWGTYLITRYKYVDYTYWMYYLLYEPNGRASHCFAEPGSIFGDAFDDECWEEYNDQLANNNIVRLHPAEEKSSISRSFIYDSSGQATNFVWLHAYEIVPGDGAYWIDETTINNQVQIIQDNLSDVDETGNPIEIVWRGSRDSSTGSEIWQTNWYWYTPSIPHAGTLRNVNSVNGYGDYYRFRYPVRTEVTYYMVVVPLSAERVVYELCLGETAPCKTSPGCQDSITLCSCKDETGDIQGCTYTDYNIIVDSMLME